MANLDQYLPCESYAGREAASQEGFSAFHNSEENQYYFALTAPDGSILLRSEGYTSEKGRDNGIASVQKNRDNVERYKITQSEDDSLWYVSLRAGNHQEIARSCGYGSEEDATMAIGRNFSSFDWPAFMALNAEIVEEEVEISETFAIPEGEIDDSSAGNGAIDEYLECTAYTGHEASDVESFVKFEIDGAFYFSMLTPDGAVLLRSESYKSEAARDNGIASVLKNKDIEKRYKIIQDEADGLWYVILKAGNHQEIARSCGYDSEITAQNGTLMCFSTFVWKTEEVIEEIVELEEETQVEVESVAEVTEENIEVKEEVIEVEKEAKVVEEKVVERKIIERRDATATHFTTRKSKEVAAPKTIQRTVRMIDSDEYLPCSSYKVEGTPDEDGFVTFTEGGKHYFAWLSPEGEVILRSESFHLSMSRDNAMASVKRNRAIEERYLVEQDENDSKWYLILKSGTGTEIARSCPLEDEAAATAWRGSAYGWRSYSWAAAPVVEEVIEETVELEDVKGEDSIIETIAVVTAAAAPLTIQVEEEEYVAPEPIVEETIIVPPVIDIPASTPEPEPIPEVPEATSETFVPQWKASEETVAETPPPVYVPPVEEYVEKSTNWSWLLWLLPLLLLAFVFWWKSCDGCSVKKQPIKTETTVAPVIQDTVEVVEAETTPVEEPAVTPCNCDRSNSLFKPCDGNIRELTRLGTNPEFGNMHGLSIEEVIAKFKRHAKRGPHHREFLDACFRGMGYSSFDDINEAMITDTTVPTGTTGQMGMGPRHQSVCAQLNAKSDRDLKAFRIKALNGCDVHFMKTCGNHFFFCEN